MTDNSVSTRTASDVRAVVAAALLTYASGVLMLVGYILLSGVFGAILGLVGAVLGVVGWRKAHDDQIFPRELPTKSLLILVAVGAVLTVLAFVMAG